jgi:hypothetical protein
MNAVTRCFRFAAAIVAVALILFESPPSADSEGSQIQLAVDTVNPNQDGLLAIYGAARLGGNIGLPITAGDLNGDGRADVVFCEIYASAGPGLRQNNGQVNVYLSDEV